MKNGLCKVVIKSQVVTKFNVTKSRLHCTRHLIVSLFFGWIEPSIISQFSFRTGNCNVGTKLMAIWDMKIFWSDTFDHQLTYCVKLSIAMSFKFVNSLLLSFNISTWRKSGLASNPLFIIPGFFLHFSLELSYGYLWFEGNGKIPLGR